MAGTTEVLLGALAVVAAGTAYAASLRAAGFGRAAPYLSAAFAAAAWAIHLAAIPAVPQLLLTGAAVVLALGFMGDA